MSAGKKRLDVYVSNGPWVPGIDPSMIKITPKKGLEFPKEISDNVDVTNNCDMITDYYQKDSIKLMPGHPLYELAKSVIVP